MTAMISDFSMMDAAQSVRIAYLLGLDDPETFSEVRLARSVGDGLPTSAADALFGGLGDVAHVHLVIPEASLRRWRKERKPLSREHSERVYELSRVLDSALRAYRGDNGRALEFLAKPHPLLDGDSPFDLAMRSSAGADAVVALIGRAVAGVAV